MKERESPWEWLNDSRLTYALKLLLVIVLALYLGSAVVSFLDRIRAVVLIVIGAVFLAYLIYPMVRRLERKMPLIASILVVYAGIAVSLGLVGWLIVPHLIADVTQLIARAPEFAKQIDTFVHDPSNPWIARLPEWMRAEIAALPDQGLAWSKEHGLQTFGQALGWLVGTVAAVATFIIVPLLTAYLLLDMASLKRSFLALIPRDRVRSTLRLLDELDTAVGGFIRGQLLVGVTVGAMITIALLILRVPYAFLLGLLAAVGDLIPYVGAVLAFVPSFTIALLNNGWVNAVIVGVVFLVIFEVEGHFIAPNIVSRSTKLSPLIVIIALLIGSDLGGILGALIAVPVAGMLRVIAIHIFGRTSS